MIQSTSLLGREVRFTLAGCDASILNDLSAVRALVYDMCKQLGVEIRAVHEEVFEPQGLSVVAILAESHCAVHTWPESGSATVDILTCGATDPAIALPIAARAVQARESAVSFGQRETCVESRERRYPRFEQYILRGTPGGHFATPTFRRGIGRSFLMEPEALAWQDFFCSKEYRPPSVQDILLLHPCSWAKPYDMSAYITRLRQVTDRHERVHRAIISNVGVVPFEYQMNPFFCSYDYSPAGGDWTPAALAESKMLFARLTADRIRRYLDSRAGHYRAVALLGHPITSGVWSSVSAAARAHGLPGFLAPSPKVYRNAQSEAGPDVDVDAPLFQESTLAYLDRQLTRLTVVLAQREGKAHG